MEKGMSAHKPQKLEAALLNAKRLEIPVASLKSIFGISTSRTQSPDIFPLCIIYASLIAIDQIFNGNLPCRMVYLIHKHYVYAVGGGKQRRKKQWALIS